MEDSSSSSNSGPAGGQSSGGNYSGGGSTSNNGDPGGNHGNNNQGSDHGHSRFDTGSGYYGEPTTSTPSSNDNDNNNVTDPGFVKALNEQKLQDYKTSLGQMDDAMGVGTITDATYNAKTGLVDIHKHQVLLLQNNIKQLI